MKSAFKIFCVFLFLSGLLIRGTLASSFPFNLGLPPLVESFAFKQFMLRPATELSKLVYLIDRLRDAEVEIIYEGYYFDAGFAAKASKWFLAKYYRDEEARAWIMKWCNTSIPSGKLIWVKDQEGNFRLSREVLLDQLEELEQTAQLQGILRLRR